MHSPHIHRVPEFEHFEWLEHGFGTRHTTGWPDPSRLSMLKQVHSANVVEAHGGAGYIGEGDALITDRPGCLIGVRTADCVPILIVDAHRRAVAAVHAGWRGTAQEIVIRSVSELSLRFGTAAEDLYAAIGPAIGPCCYAVGADVAREFERWWPDLNVRSVHLTLDLIETNRRQLIAARVQAARVFSHSPCTFCARSEFHSFRRDGKAAGRMVSAIGIRAGKG